MLNKVLGVFAFSRAPKRAVTLVVLALGAGVMGLLAQSSIAAGPTAPSITRVDTKDLNGDGYLDALVVTFDTPMDTSVAAPNGFTVGGYQPSAPPVSSWLSAAQLQLNIRPVVNGSGDTNLRPGVAYVTAASSPARSAAPFSVELATQSIPADDAKIVDGAGPALMRVLANDFGSANTFKDALDQMDFVFSEPVKVLGTTPTDRVKALDQALKFTSLNSCPMTPVDGDASNGKSNFPALKSATSVDPIVEPAAGLTATASKTIRVRMSTSDQHGPSTITNIAIPGLCAVYVDQSGASNITDAAPMPNNAFAPTGTAITTYRRDIEIAPAQLYVDPANGNAAIGTQDLVPGNGDGFIDAIKVTFDHPIDDSSATIAAAGAFHVKNGSANATVTDVVPFDASDPNDGSVLVKIGGVTWGGGIKPSVSFDGSCDLKAKVPSAGQRACTGAFGGTSGIQAFDQVPPAVKTAKTLDSDKNGMIDAVQIEVTEDVASSATKAGWSVAGSPANSLTGAGSSTLTLGVTETSSLGTAATPAVSYDPLTGDTADLAGAELKQQTFNAADGAAPRIVKATTLSSGNTATTDRVTFEFSEPVSTAGVNASAFSIEGTAATAFGSSAIDASPVGNDKLVTVEVSKPGTGHFAVAFSGGIADLAGNATTDPASLGAAEVFDAAKPVVTSLSTSPVSPFGVGQVTVTAVFSEPLDGNVAPVAKLGESTIAPVADGNHSAAGFRTAAPGTWDGVITLDGDSCAAQNGCASSVTLTGAKDAAGNVAVPATPLSVTLDTVAPSAATAELAKAVQEEGAASIGDNKIGGHTSNVGVTATITPGQLNLIGQATGGHAELLLDGESFDPAVTLTGISSTASTVTLTTAFADAAALRSAISEGEHTLAVKLCDSASNCATSTGVAVTADYTPVNVTLAGPNAGTFTGGDHVCIQWVGDSTATDFTATELRYTIDGTSYARVIASGLGVDGSLACGVEGGGYDWTIPTLNTETLKVQVSTLDSYGNTASSRSASAMKVETITETVMSFYARPTSLVYGSGSYVYGALNVADTGDAVAGQAVTIQRQIWASDAWETIATRTTDDRGLFGYYFKPHAHASYRAVFNGNGPYLSTTSVSRQIWVALSVASRINGTSFAKGQYFQVNGWVLPAHTGDEVWFQAYIGNQWVTVAKQTLTSRNYYQFWYRSTSAKTLLFRVAFPTQDRDHAWNISQRYMVSWR